MEIKRKTPIQLEALDSFYLENKYPTQMEMENYSAAVGLTYKQIKGWFVEKRRREKRENTVSLHSTSTEKGRKVVRRSSSFKHQQMPLVKNTIIQELFTPDYILRKVFRKDGPPLGVEFDFLPSEELFRCKDTGKFYPSCEENQRATKRKKVSKHAVTNTVCNDKNAPAKKHGMGKGLMTVWRATNPHAGDFPTGIDFANEATGLFSIPKPVTRNRVQVKKPLKKNIPTKQGSLRNKLQEKKKHSVKRREVESYEDGNLKLTYRTKCDLALEGRDSEEIFHHISMLMDDEELEVRELQAAPNGPGCSGHSTTGLHGCSLCKDLLAEFPPNSVKMKQPFSMQPWESSPEIVKKFFKVFHFLYTYSLDIDFCPFTLDEFAQAFPDKDSLLLGKIHVALLKLLLSDIKVELNNKSLPHMSKSCNYLALFHSVEKQEFTLDFWERSLNPLTWTEILRQVLVASGFGSKQSAIRRETLDKEMHLMVKYGLHPGTLKGELFRILLEQGNNGLKVADLAKSFSIVDLKLASTTEELECLICSILSSDITLFEKISSTTYRIRINSILKKVEELSSDTEDSGAVDDGLSESDAYSSDEDSRCDVGNSIVRKVKNLNSQKSKKDVFNDYTEIDESHRGESWLLGLMEGEYSDLNIEEKLNVMVSLIELLHAGSSIRMEEHPNTIADNVLSIYHSSSGAKIKRSSAKHQSLLISSLGHLGQIQGIKEAYAYWNYHAIDSSASISKFYEKSPDNGKYTEMWVGAHPMQSIFLGSDRRYNRYWLFLGPCNANDPGHGRVYFESSEDGHWEVIDTKEALQTLLSVLDDRGKREALLIESLERRQAFLCETMSSRMVNSNGNRHLIQFDQSDLNVVREDSCSPVSDVENYLTMTDVLCDSLPSSGAIVIEVGNKGEEQKQKLSRLQAFDSWIWSSFYLGLNAVKHGKRSYFDSLTRCECCHDLYWRDEKHCRICHTTFEIDFDQEERYAIHIATCRDKEANDMFPKVLSSQIQSLKAAIYAIESAMPEDALVGAWTKSAHKLWVKRLRRTSSLQELLQVLADFMGAINENWLCQCNALPGSCDGEEIIACFKTLPQTTSAVALWLLDLDALITPYLERAQSGKIARSHYQKQR